MDRLRRSLRDSLRRGRREHVPECSKPHQWQADEAAVRAGSCTFPVKYLGCVEVFESRGMQVMLLPLSELPALFRPIIFRNALIIRHVLVRFPSSDRPLSDFIVRQVFVRLGKASYYETSHRWACLLRPIIRLIFISLRRRPMPCPQGERLSHAVGCAFAVCLERKQKRDKESVLMNFDPKTSSFTRTGSFRQGSITDSLPQDPQEAKPSGESPRKSFLALAEQRGRCDAHVRVVSCRAEAPPVKSVVNPYAIERPHATVSMLQRQGSFRGFGSLSQTSPFKRQLSLRLNELPSNIERQRAMSLDASGDLPSR
ncbi:conserved hypothetical protein, partial [Ixodes scapularis]